MKIDSYFFGAAASAATLSVFAFRGGASAGTLSVFTFRGSGFSSTAPGAGASSAIPSNGSTAVEITPVTGRLAGPSSAGGGGGVAEPSGRSSRGSAGSDAALASGTSRSMSSKLGIGLGRSDSPVSSDIPNRSSASSRLFPFEILGFAAAGGCDARPMAGASRGGGALIGPVPGATRPVPVVFPAPNRPVLPRTLSVLPLCGEVRGASKGGSSMVPPVPAESDEVPDFFAENTVLQLLQRTRTPRSVTFSSATRKRDWQLGHWTTTLPFSQCQRSADKESSCSADSP